MTWAWDRTTSRALLLLLAPLLLAGCSLRGSNVSDVLPRTTVLLPSTVRVPHIAVIVLENKSSTDVVGSSSAPYLTGLARRYGYAAGYYGVTHPSLPNYVSMIAGSYLGASSDNPSQRFHVSTLVDQLQSHGRSWKAYMESLPYAGYSGDQYPVSGTGLYARKHDPFMLVTTVLDRPTRRSRVVPMTALTRDLARNTLPDFSFIVPNLCHDMHGIGGFDSPCPGSTSDLVRAGDRYLSGLVPMITRSRSWTADSTLFIIWDESDDGSTVGCCDGPNGSGGGHVPAIVVARQGVRGYRSSATYNHYSLLKTIETIWGLRCLRMTCDSRHVHPMTQFLRSVRP